jgi:hypothetical protein
MGELLDDVEMDGAEPGGLAAEERGQELPLVGGDPGHPDLHADDAAGDRVRPEVERRLGGVPGPTGGGRRETRDQIVEVPSHQVVVGHTEEVGGGVVHKEDLLVAIAEEDRVGDPVEEGPHQVATGQEGGRADRRGLGR